MAVLDTFQHQDLEAIRVGRFNMGINTTFIVYRLGKTVFDTGPSNQWKYVKGFIEEKPLEQLILTHHHEDHSGNAGAIKKMTGVTPLAPEITASILRKGFKIPPVQKIMWGSAGPVETDTVPDRVTLSNGEMATAVFAPGHAKDMTCYLLEDRGWLLSADLYIANHLKFLRNDEDVPTIINSTQNVLKHDFDTIICPHKGIVPEGQKRLQEKLDYLLTLSGKAQHMRNQGINTKEITQRLLGKEGMMSLFSGYNFSKINLIRSCLAVNLASEPTH